jgi:hypothetical protein
MNRGVLVLLLSGACAAGCGSCSDKSSEATKPAPSSGPSASASTMAFAEALPRCRADGPKMSIEGEDVVVGDAVVEGEEIFVGLARRKGTAGRVGSILRVKTDLTGGRVIDIAPIHGDGASPSVFFKDGKPLVVFNVRKEIEAGTTRGMRELRIAPLEDNGIGALAASITQQADESTSFDVAWPLVAWDEDALVPQGKFIPDHGVVKVQSLPDGKPHVVSPDTTDAETPKLAPRGGKGGGWWVAWVARKPEVEDAGWRIEGAGDLRAWRWVEIVALDGSGEVASPVRRVTPEKAHVVAFDFASAGERGESLAVIVQDEGAASEGGGSRVSRYVIESDRVGATEILDGGLGHALADLVPAADAGWLAWKDNHDHAWIVPASASFVPTAKPTAEATLDGARVLAAAGRSQIFVTSGGELRRFTCVP